MSDRKDLDASASMKFLMLWNLYIVALLIAATLIGAARRRRRRSRGRYIKGNIEETLSLSTLASSTLISEDFDETVNEKTFVSSIVATYVWDNFTNDADGPLIFGVAHSDYTDAEIEAVIEASASWNTGDLVAQEVGRRKIRKIGSFAPDQAASANLGDWRFNDGKPVKTKLNWQLMTGQTLSLWAYNKGNTLGGSSLIRMDGHANLWQK